MNTTRTSLTLARMVATDSSESDLAALSGGAGACPAADGTDAAGTVATGACLAAEDGACAGEALGLLAWAVGDGVWADAGPVPKAMNEVPTTSKADRNSAIRGFIRIDFIIAGPWRGDDSRT